ncbi:MAG: hypothetical protein SGJ11_06950 [Phycisphaerae bacterium]|nr:hypothetical protein [Phycisphaerae bacterium]
MVGASTSGSGTGGGSPSQGLAVGETGTYVFTVGAAASLLANIDAMSFWSQNDGSPEFAVRFRGFENGGSDKVAGQLTVVPVPLPIALAAAGLLIGAVVRRRIVR